MSTEVAKKRGRPKKVITEPVDVEVPDGAKKVTTRAKSTKAGPKTTKATTSASKASPASNPVQAAPAKPAAARKTTSKSSSPASTPPKAQTPKAETKPAAPKAQPKVDPNSSKILTELRQQAAKNASGTSSSSPKQSATLQSPQPKIPTAPSANPKAAPPPPHKVPIAGLNKQIVGDIAARAGARPNAGAGPGRPLPKNYKSVANKVTMAIIAMPIALVTSWVLYERLVLGEEQKLLVKQPPPPPPEETPSTS